MNVEAIANDILVAHAGVEETEAEEPENDQESAPVLNDSVASLDDMGAVFLVIERAWRFPARTVWGRMPIIT